MPADDRGVYTRSGYARARYARRVGVQWSRAGALARGRRRTARSGSEGPRTGSRILAVLLIVPLVLLVVVAS
jgi:hypothetical protein